MEADTPFFISKIAQQGILEFHKQSYQMLNQQWNIREQFRRMDLAYNREVDWLAANSRAKLANRYGDTNKFQNITVPIVLPQVESAVTYQASVFLTGNPLFQVSSSPENEDAAMQMNTIIEENSTRGGWVRELLLFFRDGFKYNLSALEVTWDKKMTAELSTDLTFSSKQARPKQVVWEGNCIKRLDMYNTFFDARWNPADIAEKGEFVGYTELVSRVYLKQFIDTLADRLPNAKEAYESGLGTAVGGGFSIGGIESYYMPQLNPDALISKNIRATVDWMAWAGVTENKTGTAIQYKNLYELTTLYGRIIPSDFGIKTPGANTPQVWKFYIVNHSVVIYAQRQTNAHELIPVLFGQPLEDGLGYQTKSLAANEEPMQAVASAMMNSLIASRRRAISDRTLYDPSRVSEHHINSDSPTAKIPVRPSAYGKPVSEAVYAFPYRDDQAGLIMQEIAQLNSFANVISGQNQVRQGQFVKGNKTLHEFSDVMSHANGRDQMTSMLYEVQVFTPLKMILKTNILQYQGAGSVYSESQQKEVKIDPVKLRQTIMAFKVSDGLIPSDKLMNTDTLQVAMQVIGSSPQLAGGYNVAPLFSYIMKLGGATDLHYFEKSPQQIAYEQASQQWMMLAQTAIEKGQQFSIPQPKPADFGYTPGMPTGNGSSPGASGSNNNLLPNIAPETKVNNITNNVTQNTGG